MKWIPELRTQDFGVTSFSGPRLFLVLAVLVLSSRSSISEEQLKSKLDMARPTRAQHRVVASEVRRCAGTTELPACTRIGDPRPWGEVGTVKDIEELKPQLSSHAFL